MRRLLLILLALALISAAPAPFTPYLVKDINPEYTPASSDPRDFVSLRDLVLFRIGFGLWRSDGSASGTYPLTAAGHQLIASTGDRWFFHSGGRFWVTDGTLPGTFSLGEASSYMGPRLAAWVSEQELFYFASEVPGQGHGLELWRSDGTPGGTYEVLDIEPGPGSSNPDYFTSFQGRLYFTVKGNLWKSDGTAQGTALVRDIQAESPYVLESRLVFLGRDAAHGQELWASDGTTAGTRRIADLVPGESSPSYIHGFRTFGKLLYFFASAGDSDLELYVTDGTEQGTRKLTSFPGSWPFSYDFAIASLGDRHLFAADDGTHGSELWSTDGTRMVLDACPGSCSFNPIQLSAHQGKIYYQSTDETHGSELWVTDGTAQGTRMVKDVCPGSCGDWLSIFPSLRGRLLFTSINTGNRPVSHALWSTDGTEEGTVSLGMAGSSDGTAAGGVLFFPGIDPDHGCEPWISDGTPEGTHLVADLARQDVGGSQPEGLMRLGRSVLFSAEDGEGSALWRSDGTEAGTVMLKRGVSEPSYLTGSASRVVFKTSAGVWISDGSEAGTLRLTPEGADISSTVSAAQSGSRILFSARDAGHGAEPWVSDGTRKGTRRLADLVPGPKSSSPACFTAFRGKVWFGALSRLWRSDGRSAVAVARFRYKSPDVCPFMTFGGRLLFTVGFKSMTQLWSTDGARLDFIDQSRNFDSRHVVFRGRLWFTSKDVLWSTDGTTAGTESLLTLPGEQAPDQIMSDGALLYLCVRDPWDDGTGLWISDGTEEGTRKISDLDQCGPWALLDGRLHLVGGDDARLYRSDGTGTQPVRPDGEPDHVMRLLPLGNRLIAFTDDGEVWQTDGTAAGTMRVRDQLITRSPFVKAGPRLFFPAWDEDTGWELWAMTE